MSEGAALRVTVFVCGVGPRTAKLIAHILGDANAVRLIRADDEPAGGVTVLTGVDPGIDVSRDALIVQHLLARPKGAPLVVGIGDVRAGTIARQVAMSGRGEELHKVAPGVCLNASRWPGLQGPGDDLVALCAIAACEALDVDQSMIDKGLESFGAAAVSTAAPTVGAGT